MAVPLFDTSSALLPLRDELRAAVARVLESERYILGPEVAAFEQESGDVPAHESGGAGDERWFHCWRKPR